MSDQEPEPAVPPAVLPYCIECGTRLRAEDRFCSVCGTGRWLPPAAPPVPTAPARDAAPSAPAGPAPSRSVPPEDVEATVRVIPWIYAAGAILSALWLTSSLAFAVAPKGRSQLMQDITSTHVAASEASLVLALRIAFSVGIPAVLLVGHGLAYYGLRARARWGWLSAVIIAGLWSIVLAGIPVLVRLLRREVREAYGVV